MIVITAAARAAGLSCDELKRPGKYQACTTMAGGTPLFGLSLAWTLEPVTALRRSDNLAIWQIAGDRGTQVHIRACMSRTSAWQ